MSGIFSALSGLANASWKAFIGIIMAIIMGTVISAFVGASFNTVQTTLEDNPAASSAVEAGETAYEVVSTVQDAYDYWKIVLPVAVAIAGVVSAVLVVIKKARSYL